MESSPELGLNFGDEAAEHGRLFLLDIHAEPKVERLDDRSGPDPEEIAEGFGAVEHQREYIGVSIPCSGNDGMGIVLLQREDLLLELLRGLEIERFGGAGHLLAVASQDISNTALQKGGDLIDPTPVLLGRDGSDAASPAFPDVEIQAGSHLLP